MVGHQKGIALSLPMKPDDPAYWMLHDEFTTTPVKDLFRDSCYICTDPEFAQMGLPLCYACGTCGGHVAADDEECENGHVNQPGFMKYPNPAQFGRIYVEVGQDLSWDVLGRKVEDGEVSIETIENFPNMALAEAFVRVYCEEYVRYSRFDAAQDC